MNRSLNLINAISGIVLTTIVAFAVWPITIQVMVQGVGRSGLEKVLIPILIPLCFSVLFGMVGILSVYTNYHKLKKYYIGAHLIIVLSCIATYVFIPVMPFSLILAPLVLILLVNLSKKTINWQILLFNSGALIISLYFLILDLRFDDHLSLWELFSSIN